MVDVLPRNTAEGGAVWIVAMSVEPEQSAAHVRDHVQARAEARLEVGVGTAGRHRLMNLRKQAL
jgi:hypothetical protein